MSELEKQSELPADVGTMLTNVAGLSNAQNTTLAALSESVRPLTVAELAEKLGLHHNSVRETLDALVQHGLVVRTRKSPKGRGRPSWAYEAMAPASLESFARQLTSIVGAVTAYLRQNADDPKQAAIELGRLWGAEILANANVPDHSQFDHAQEAQRLAVHTSKVRLFLSSMGYAATQSDDPTEFELRQCPLLGTIERGMAAGDKYPLACAMHQGLLDGLMLHTTSGYVEADLTPQIRPGVCRVRLSAVQPN